jgi:hypothetical protein
MATSNLIPSKKKLLEIYEGDTIRVINHPQYAKTVFKAISIFEDLVEIAIGEWVPKDKVQKKIKGKFYTIN